MFALGQKVGLIAYLEILHLRTKKVNKTITKTKLKFSSKRLIIDFKENGELCQKEAYFCLS